MNDARVEAEINIKPAMVSDRSRTRISPDIHQIKARPSLAYEALSGASSLTLGWRSKSLSEGSRGFLGHLDQWIGP
jgi:hypothetical protein